MTLVLLAVLVLACGIGVVVMRPTGRSGTVLLVQSGTRLVVLGKQPKVVAGFELAGDGFTLNSSGCVQFGDFVAVGLPGSSIAADGKTATFRWSNGVRKTYRIGDKSPVNFGASSLGSGLSLPLAVSASCGLDAQYVLVD